MKLIRCLAIGIWMISTVLAPTHGLAQTPPLNTEPLPVALDNHIKRLGFNHQGISLLIHEIGQPSPKVSLAAQTPRNPASVMKLMTTATALAKLGIDFQWPTQAYLPKPLDADTLNGDFYIKGYGDPFFMPAFLWRFIYQIHLSGLQHINGDVILDRSYFDVVAENPGEFDDQPYRAYNVQPDALLLNFQTLALQIQPKHNRVEVQSFPVLSNVNIINRLTLVQGQCGRWAKRITYQVEFATHITINLAGRFAKTCQTKILYRSVRPKLAYFEGLFRSLWQERGGTITGKFRYGKVPPQAHLLYQAQSLPLAEIIRRINKYSNNVMTQQLLLTLGAEHIGTPGTQVNGLKVIKDWLKEQPLNHQALVLDNGAGLSRDARTTAQMLADLLLLLYDKPYMPEFMSSLPVIGVDGTIANRQVDAALAGKAHIKTGLLDFVRSLAGYVHSRSGKRFVVVLLHNHPKAHTQQGEHLQAAVLNWVYTQ